MSYFERKENQTPRYIKYTAVSDNINILTIVAQFIVLVMVVLLFVLPVFNVTTSTGDSASFSFFGESKYLVEIISDFIKGDLDHNNLEAPYKVAVAYSSVALLAFLAFIITTILLLIAHIRSIVRLCRSKTDAMMKYHRIKNLGYLGEKSFSKRRTIKDFFVILLLIVIDLILFRKAPVVASVAPTALFEFRKAAAFSGVSPIALVFLVLIVIYAIVVAHIKRQEKILVALVHREETI